MPAIVTSGEGWNEWRPHGAPIVSVDPETPASTIVTQNYIGPMSAPFSVSIASAHPTYSDHFAFEIDPTRSVGSGGLGEIRVRFRSMPDVLSGTGLQASREISISVSDANISPVIRNGTVVPANGALDADFEGNIEDNRHIRGSITDSSSAQVYAFRAKTTGLTPGRISGTLSGTISNGSAINRKLFSGTLDVQASETTLGETAPVIYNPNNPLDVNGNLIANPFADDLQNDGYTRRYEYIQYSFRYPALRISATRTRAAFTQIVGARVGIAYFRMSDAEDASTQAFGAVDLTGGVLPTIRPTQFFDGDGNPVRALRNAFTVNSVSYDATDPTASEYAALIGSGGELVAESTFRRFAGLLWERRTTYVPIL